MNAKIDNFSEMEKFLRVKNDTNDGMLALFGRFGIGNLLRHLSMEKKAGIDAVTLIVSLCLFRMNSLSIFSAYRNRFHGLLDYGKNSFYRMMLRPSMDWRRLLIGMVCRFEAILRKNGAEHHDLPRCYILDDTTLEKTGRAMEKASMVFDHVSGRFVLGFKLLFIIGYLLFIIQIYKKFSSFLLFYLIFASITPNVGSPIFLPYRFA